MSRLYKIYGYYQPQENKWYVGRTFRKYQSERSGKDGKAYIEKCPKFSEAIQKYGWSSFEYQILETTEDEKLSWELEKKWIALKDSFNNGYNSDTGGKEGRKVCEESLERMSNAAKKRNYNQEWRKNHSEKMREYWQQEGVRERMSVAHKGRPSPWKGKHIPEETKKKMKESSPNSKPVFQYSMDGKFIAKYPSQKEAERQTGIKQNTISNYLRRTPKKRYCTDGFIWSYTPL